MAEILLDQLTKFVVLNPKIDKYKKRYRGRNKNYAKLLTIIDRHLNEKLEEANRKTLDAQMNYFTPQHSTTSTTNCVYWLNGHCFKGRSCKDLHDPTMKGKVKKPPAAPAVQAPPQGGAQSAAEGGPTPAAPAPSKGGGKDKGKGKGKGKGDQNKGGGEGTKEEKHKVPNPRNLCAHFQTGTCTRVGCPFIHEMGTPEEQKELERLRGIIEKAKSRSNSPSAGGKRYCYAFINTGTCDRGQRCNFEHAHPPKGKGKGGGKDGKK